MSKKELEHIIDKIKEAELVLVGLGEELDLCKELKTDERCAQLGVDMRFASFIKRGMLDEIKQHKNKFYDNLAKCLKDKNYFIVSLCMDGAIHNSTLNKERIVEPCGNYERLQCSEKCTSELYEFSQEILQQLKAGVDESRESILPLCPHCKSPLVFNNVEAENYAEEGYLEQWQIYKKWLQGTVNKNVCVLELGVGMKYPTVVRWPFEKITFFNQKAELFRVHSRLYQMTEELKDRGTGICQSPEDFLKELSNGF
ncbi:MAG: hypothetical protein NC429_16640 [Lachnospiraceae bacterium]|nr:hypothetical protein [Lachnospiraceae bacterium]